MSDYRQRYEDPEEAHRTALDGRQAAIWTALPGIITKVNVAALTCEVQPAIMGRQTAQDGTVSDVKMPLCVDVPIVFPHGGGCVLTFPVAVNDECLLVFASRCIDAHWQSGGVQKQAEMRMHDLSDGFALVGHFSQATKPANISTVSTQLRSMDGTTYFDLNPAAQTMAFNAPGGMTLTAPTLQLNVPTTTSTGDVVASMVSLVNHVHTGVVVGGAETGKPVP